MRRLDLVEYLSADSGFAQAFSQYDSVGVVGQYVVHRRRGTGPFALADVGPDGSGAAVRAPDETALDPGALPLAALFGGLLGFFYLRSSPRGTASVSLPESA